MVTIALIGILVTLLYPLFVSARRRAHQAQCQSNEYQIGRAFAMYVADYDGYWPRTGTSDPDFGWGSALQSYLKARPQELACPEVISTSQPLRGAIPGYAYNFALQYALSPIGPIEGAVHEAIVQYPAVTVTLGEEAWGVASTFGPDPYKFMDTSRRPAEEEEGWKRHFGGANYLFCDGHVKWYLPDAVGYNIAGSNNGTRPTFAIGAAP